MLRNSRTSPLFTAALVVCLLTCQAAIPTKVELYAEELAPYNTVDEICLGQKSVVRCVASFPAGDTNGVSIELLPSVGKQNLVIGNITSATSGSALTIGSGWDAAPTHAGTSGCIDSLQRVEYKNRAVYTLGTVSNSGGNLDVTAYQVQIEFEVILACIEDESDSTVVWNSCGMEYADGTYIWVAQDSFTLCLTPSVVALQPSFTFPDITSISQGEPLVEELVMNIPNPSTSLKVVVLIIEGKGDLYVTDIKLTSAGEAFAYALVMDNLKTVGYDTCPQDMLELDFGVIVNKESQEAGADEAYNNLKLDIGLQAFGEIGSKFSFGIVVEMGPSSADLTDIFVASRNLTLQQGNLPNIGSMTLTGVETKLPAGYAGYARLVVPTPRKTRYEYTLTLTASKAAPEYTEAMSIIVVVPTVYGANLPCPIPDTVLPVFQTTDDRNHAATYTFTIANTGLANTGMDPADEADDEITFNLVVMMKQNISVESEQHILTVKLVEGGVVQEDTVTFTVAPAQPYPETALFSFTLTNTQDSANFMPASSAHFDYKVCTERGLQTGPARIEFPIPAELDTPPVLKFCSASITNIGKNNLCVQPGALVATEIECCPNTTTPTFWAAIDLPTLCNFPIVTDDAEQDCFNVEAVVQIQDLPSLTTVDTNTDYQFSIGMKYTTRQIYIAHFQMTILPTHNLASIMLTQNVRLPTSHLDPDWMSKYDLQYSSDRLTYHSSPHQLTRTIDGSDSILTPEMEILTQYPRLTTKQCTPVSKHPSINYGTTNADDVITVYGTEAGSNKLLSGLMLTVDKDHTTCINIHKQFDPILPPIFWTQIATSFFNLNGSQAYNLKLVGKGLVCSGKTLPRITWVKYPKAILTETLNGDELDLCETVDDGIPDEDRLICRYRCECLDSISCGKLLLFIANTAAPGGDFQLCEVEVTPM